jgi:Flp pilus assembly pilin Flp
MEFLHEEDGATVLEYAWIASLISIAAIPAFYAVRGQMQDWYWPAINALAS